MDFPRIGAWVSLITGPKTRLRAKVLRITGIDASDHVHLRIGSRWSKYGGEKGERVLYLSAFMAVWEKGGG